LSSFLRPQRTIGGGATVEGFGYWSGQDVRVEFRPAPENTGIVFVRGDLAPPRRIAAVVHNRIEVPRRSSLAAGGATVEMVEHVMAALHGLQIDNCEVWVDRPEMPGVDGSCLPFLTALEAVGLIDQTAPRAQLRVDRVVRVGDEQAWSEARPAHGEGYSIEASIDYGVGSVIGRQSLWVEVTRDRFRSTLAGARTFILAEEAEWLRRQGLGTRVTARDLLVFGADGPIDNPLRFADECVRHKTMDVIGDLALAGYDLVGHFVTHCGGHRLNAQLVKHLLACCPVVRELRKTA
jgi:UDP-3-O-[3-hydroxymyristoyl] N-acetylglucosamine deacetylase